MERKTRKEQRTKDRVATSDLARVLRRRSSIRLFLVGLVVTLVLPVGCSSWRSLGRVDSQRGEYIFEDEDADAIWRVSKSENLEDMPNIRGKDVEMYDVSSDVHIEKSKSEPSFSERFKYMFRKPKSVVSTPVPDTWDAQKVEKLHNSSNYLKDAPTRSETRASLSGKPDVSESSRESFWTKIFHSSREVSPEFDAEPKNSVEPRAGGLARDNAQNARQAPDQTSIAKRSTEQTYVRRRWSSRDPQNDVKSFGTTRTQNEAPSPVVRQERPKTTSSVVAKTQTEVDAFEAIQTRDNPDASLIRRYNSQSFLPPFDLIEQYYYPGGSSAETNSTDDVSNKAARAPFRSSVYAQNAAVITSMSVSQVSYDQPQTADLPDTTPAPSRVQKSDSENSKVQDEDLLERRREFDWFDFAPNSLTSSEQTNDLIAESDVEELNDAVSTNLSERNDLSERNEEKTIKPRSADEILDESARRRLEVENSHASQNVSYEAPTNDKNFSPNVSTIGVDVAGTSNLDVSTFLNQTTETRGVVAAVNSLDERKAESGTKPLTHEEIEWVRHVEEAIQGLLKEREELKNRGEDASLCDMRLRLLYLVVGEYDRQVQTIADANDPLKLFWEKECDGLETLLQNKLEEIDPSFVAETLLSGLDSFFDVCDVQIRKALLVDTPACFGLFEERVKPYRPGEVVYAYAELDYVVSKETTRGHEIAVECRWRLLDANGNALTEFKTQRCENVSETRLRDVVLNVAVPLSDEIAPNDYLLELEVVDLNARESVATTRRLNVKVVADAESGARG